MTSICDCLQAEELEDDISKSDILLLKILTL